MRDIIIDLLQSNKLKTQLTMEINFISSKDVDQERVLYKKSDNKEFMTYDNANDIFDELFNTHIWRY